MFTLHPIPALTDNYIWLLHNGQQAWVVDPGEAAPVQAYLTQHSLALAGILLTHHHHDHTGGVDGLRQTWGCPVLGPAFEELPEPVQRVSEGTTVQALGLALRVLDVPGHTAGHVAYVVDGEHINGAPLLFCGDTLFSAGCGRLFEGTAAQMHASLQKIASLPDSTQVCCTHEYTLSNLKFALAVEPDNPDLPGHVAHCQALRAQGRPTLPSTLGLEKRINPFLRAHLPSVAQAVLPGGKPAEVFAALREWKNRF